MFQVKHNCDKLNCVCLGAGLRADICKALLCISGQRDFSVNLISIIMHIKMKYNIVNIFRLHPNRHPLFLVKKVGY